MTCIVGVTNGRRVWMGGDSAGIDDSDLSVVCRREPKVFVNNGYLIGYTTSFRMGQVLHHAVKFPKAPIEGDLHRFMCTEWVDAVRESFEKAGFGMKTQSGQEEGGDFLVGVSGRLFHVYPDFNVEEPSDGYAAVGCGAMPALGTLYASKLKPGPALVRKALSAAEHFSGGVRAPFTVRSTS